MPHSEIYEDTENNTKALRLARVRDAADGVTVASITDEQVLEKLEKSDVWISVITNKFDWIETDKEWETVLEASENRAASKIPGITKETYDQLVADYRLTTKALTGKDKELQSKTIDPISASVNIVDQLDPDVYIPEQEVFTNDEFGHHH